MRRCIRAALIQRDVDKPGGIVNGYKVAIRAMLDFLRPLRAWLVAIGFLLLCFAILNSSSSFQSCIQQQWTQSTNSENNKYLTTLGTWAIAQRGCIGGFIHNRHNEILAAFTVILAVATIFLWIATRDLVREAEDTAKRQLRAYVFVSGSAVTN